MQRLPHPIPYQGSKRSLAPVIANYVPDEIETWFEPFAGSAAMSIWIAAFRRPKRIVLGDSLVPLAELWSEILAHPDRTALRYREIWLGQREGDAGYFNHVRARFNADRDPVDLLYLLCRCVKNAVRFNAKGQFTQSVDKRRLGMSPDKMSRAIGEASALLGPITEIRSGDWLDTVAEAQTSDFVYMDPPYMGTSAGRDRRYAEWMSRDRLVDGLVSLRASRLRFALSYDGRVGERTYGEPLPADLGMTHLMLHAGRSSQATLNGSSDHTYESLYLSHGISLAASQSGPEQGAQSSFLRAA